MQLRAFSDIITSAATMDIYGTSGDDVISAPGKGYVIKGFKGNDTLTSTYNWTDLYGGDGNDTLTTTISLTDADVLPFDVWARQSGGLGDDTLTIDIQIDNFDWPGGGTIETVAKGGAGNDTISVNTYFVSDGGTGDPDQAIRNNIYGGAGNDVIDARADNEGNPWASLAENYVEAGSGNDTVTVRAYSQFFGFWADVKNEVWAGNGDDTISAFTALVANAPRDSENFVYGQGGADTIYIHNYTDSNSDGPVALNHADGGHGNDTINAIVENSLDHENVVSDNTNTVLGGSGDDMMTGTILGRAEDQVFAVNQMDGGNGNDTMTADITVSAGYSSDAMNSLFGQSGHDTMMATIGPGTRGYPSMFSSAAHNLLDGGSGNDTMTATILSGTGGHSAIYGGSGNDNLTVIGGSDNILDGGSGNDELTAGLGDDLFIGGYGADVFAFDVALDQGTETLADFGKATDALRFHNLTDTGAPGLVDDLDAISTFADDGADVTVTINSGTVLIFENAGTGEVDSFGDLVADPLTQLLTTTDVFVFA